MHTLWIHASVKKFHIGKVVESRVVEIIFIIVILMTLHGFSAIPSIAKKTAVPIPITLHEIPV